MTNWLYTISILLQVFISYLTSAANDICKDAKRQTISADDVFTALQDLDFGELINPTKEALEGWCLYEAPLGPNADRVFASAAVHMQIS